MAERHGMIDRKEYYYVIKAFRDNEDPNKIHYLFDHDTCLARFSEGIVWNNKTGVWENIEGEDAFDIAVCDDVWEKLNMLDAAQKYIYEIQEAMEKLEDE
jgi:hypothetical protein